MPPAAAAGSSPLLSDAAAAGLLLLPAANNSLHDLGPTTFYLGIEITRDRANRSITMSQSSYIDDIVTRFEMGDAKHTTVPISPSAQLARTTGTPLDTASAHLYPEIIGSLLYLAMNTRPDIAHAVSSLAKFMSCPTSAHLAAARSVLRYVAGTPTLGITYRFTGSSADQLTGYTDASFAGDLDNRRSTTGYVFLYGGAAITWNSRLQPTVAASTTKAEYQSCTAAAREALWLRSLFFDLGISISGPVRIACDNQGALSLLKNPLGSARAKHIDVLHHFARERVARNEISFEYVSTELMVADSLTKHLPFPKFEFCRSGMLGHP